MHIPGVDTLHNPQDRECDGFHSHDETRYLAQ